MTDRLKQANRIWGLFQSRLISSTAAIAYITYLYENHNDDDDITGSGGHIGEQLARPSLETYAEVGVALLIATWLVYAWSRSRQEEAA